MKNALKLLHLQACRSISLRNRGAVSRGTWQRGYTQTESRCIARRHPALLYVIVGSGLEAAMLMGMLPGLDSFPIRNMTGARPCRSLCRQTWRTHPAPQRADYQQHAREFQAWRHLRMGECLFPIRSVCTIFMSHTNPCFAY